MCLQNDVINYKSIGHLYGSGWPVALGHCCNCQVTQVQPTAPARTLLLELILIGKKYYYPHQGHIGM
jgi:hypothetical protein